MTQVPYDPWLKRQIITKQREARIAYEDARRYLRMGHHWYASNAQQVAAIKSAQARYLQGIVT